jgi:hypothetical protein
MSDTNPGPDEYAGRAEATLWQYRPRIVYTDHTDYPKEIETAICDLAVDTAHLLAKLGEAQPVTHLLGALTLALHTHYSAEVTGDA